MQNITQSWFVQGMIKATTDAWLKGWDERNGGNLTLRLDDADIAPYHDNFHQQPRYIPLSQPMPLLANTPFIVTGSGKFFRNVQLDPAANLGIVKVDSDGAGYHILWGLTNEAVPTSELPAHFLSHCERIKATNGKDRVIMHCHATNLIALTYVLENDTAVFTRQLWEGSTECLVVFPDGVGILPWMVPGTDEIGQATAQEMQKHSLVLWPFHGVFGSGPTLDETFGLIDTAEKSAQVANMIRKAFVMQVNPDAHEEYQRRHNPIWPELEAVLKSHGAHNYAIYLDKARNLLFAMVEIESEERWNAVASTDVCQRWWKYMTDVMPANPDNSPVSSELQEVFYLP